MLKNSKQREAIKEFLLERKDHPTADVVYIKMREKFPNISLGTVYRNLTLLSNNGEISRLHFGDNVDHFDATITPHYHVICEKCNKVMDLDLDISIKKNINSYANEKFNGVINNHVTYFCGICEDCLKNK